MLERVLPPQAKPVADSADMECSPALGEMFAGASALAKELHHDKVEPLHLVAVMLSTETGGVDEILKRAGISREARRRGNSILTAGLEITFKIPLRVQMSAIFRQLLSR